MSRLTWVLGVFILFILVLAGGLWWYIEKNNTGTPITSESPKTGPIVFFGDSLVEGVGATPGHNLPSLLQREVSVRVLNYGRAGDTTSQALARIDTAIAEKPQLALILLGGNDFLQHVPAAQTFANLKRLVIDFQASGAKVLILGVRSGLLGAGKAEAEYERVADETNVEYFPDVLSGLFGNDEYMSDAIHPNDAGYAKISARLVPVVKKLLAE